MLSAPNPGASAPTPRGESTVSSRIFTTSVSPGSAPAIANGPVSGLSPLTIAMVSPGFRITLPNASNVLVSSVSPGLSVATGGTVA